ncbi:MAG: xanthine dehydrogenase family protein molybdopterin-binding subunit [Desulfarculus sp.]|nr:xanthine dehydrogenase family protein molybdopterin-binding subunit [Pseudomonadota bacterium]MBU4575051.1 xanthine dehydrogenase family protein molybdopterin-binding subunit [Pseudomonadota bacterium]MBU4598258.1 xanthine dehydrogenase family protein molybdopterin-binding subunit [Pseudomonadota bacterium]MBV1715195.1 xanthine dehydrogenase family protein molybdopterin-binding subunit [Desulfarculus sp.]MBV1736693.1 xanthine dehydrogenase family protein molybdopterin-binding subunit [Desulf
MQDKMQDKNKTQVLTKARTGLEHLIKTAGKSLTVAGTSVARRDDPLKVTGKLKYGADYPDEGFLYGKILRSPHPHALIKSINTKKAKELEGVVAVLTAEDVPGRNGFGAIIPDQPVICGDKVRFIGDGVALVAAESEKIAHEALKLIEVDYEPLPALFDPRDAMAEGAPKIHESGNLLSDDKMVKGDVDAGFAEADVILERTYQVPFLEHAYLEPDTTMARLQPDGVMLVEGPMQAPFTTRRNVAPVLGIPINQVRVRQIHMGGGFGGKEDSPIDIGCRAAVLAWHTGRPVKISLEREEITIQTAKRHPMIMELKVGAKKDGTLTAFQGVIYDEQGAYASLGPKIPPAGGSHVHAMVMMPGPYEIPNVKVDAYLVYTNHPYGGAMRGFGAPQVHIAHEQMMDELAAELGISAVDIRRKNAFKLGSATATGQVLNQSVGLRETLEACAERFDWDRRLAECGWVDQAKTKRRGVGVAMGWYRTSIGTNGDGCGAAVHVHEDGSVLLYSGITEMGQGAFTVLPQICAEELGIEPGDVRIVQPDTDLVPESGPTVGSRSTTLMGNAIILAARQVKESLLDTASMMLMVPTERLEARGRKIYDRENPGKSLGFAAVAARTMASGKRMIGQGWWTPPPPSLDGHTGQGSPYHVYTYSTHMVQLVVDVETGEVALEDYVAAFDVGKAINPKALEGQIEGGVAMGLGYALMEEVVLDHGVTQNPSLQGYLIPTMLDVPDIQPLILEVPNEMGPYGAKGIGEMPNIPATPAILNAIAHASGGRVSRLPADPEKVFWAIREAGGPPQA